MPVYDQDPPVGISNLSPIGSPYWGLFPPYQAADYLNSLEEAKKTQELLNFVRDLKDFKFTPADNWQIVPTSNKVKKSNGYLNLFL